MMKIMKIIMALVEGYIGGALFFLFVTFVLPIVIVVGFVTVDGEPPKSEALKQWPTLGRYDEMHRFIRQWGVREVLIADPEISPQLLFDTMVKCGRG